MDPPLPSALLDLESTPCQDALRRIVDVFQDGYRAAASLRSSADSLSPTELKVELEAIEQTMLTQISTICVTYELQEAMATRH